jgi:hypothetical protein
MTRAYVNRGKDKTNLVKSQIFNIDNGNGTTIDECVFLTVRPIKLISAKIVYDTETAGTVAAGTMGLGTSVAGVDVVAATAYTNSATIGTKTAMTLLKSIIPASTMLVARHTGVASVAAGQAHLELEYQEA